MTSFKKPERGFWAPTVDRMIELSERVKGVELNDLETGRWLKVQTRNTSYFIEKRLDGFYIAGHPKSCPAPVKANINGSTWGGSVIKLNFVGLGMHLEFVLPGNRVITTSAIQKIEEFSLAPASSTVE